MVWPAEANITVKHIREVSLSVLFLEEAAFNRAFGVSASSTAHPSCGADKDIIKMMAQINKKIVTLQDDSRISFMFAEITGFGLIKFNDYWEKETLDRTSTDFNLLEEIEKEYTGLAIQYSIANVQSYCYCMHIYSSNQAHDKHTTKNKYHYFLFSSVPLNHYCEKNHITLHNSTSSFFRSRCIN